MKKQINPTIKAYLIRSAFYLLLLVAVCAIPFALAQSRSRGTTKQSVAKPVTPPSNSLTPLSKLKPVSNPGAPPSTRAISAQLPYDVRGVPNLPRLSQVPQRTSGVGAAHVLQIPRRPKAPQVVLYDQYQ